MDYKDRIIENVSEYLLWIKETNSSEILSDVGKPLSFETNYCYYRGQSCSCWELKPSVLREPPDLDENSLLKKATLRLWNEISSLKTYLEKMIFFQHYGLSTRLLDVTFNPLVALYMACCDESKKSCDGVVFCGHGIENQNSKIAELTAKYVFENEVQRIIVDFQRFLKDEEVNIESFTQPIFILPPINNPRIEAQNGAFIMAPLINNNMLEDKSIPAFRKGLGETNFFDERRAIVKGSNKENVLHELSVLGIDSGSIFKSISEKLKAIVTEEKWNTNRFNNIQI